MVFGGGSAGIKLAPFDAGQHGRRTLKTVGLDHLQLTAALLVGAALIAMLAKAVAALALIPDRGWADSRAVFLLVFSAAGLAAYGLLGYFPPQRGSLREGHRAAAVRRRCLGPVPAGGLAGGAAPARRHDGSNGAVPSAPRSPQ